MPDDDGHWILCCLLLLQDNRQMTCHGCQWEERYAKRKDKKSRRKEKPSDKDSFFFSSLKKISPVVRCFFVTFNFFIKHLLSWVSCPPPLLLFCLEPSKVSSYPWCCFLECEERNNARETKFALMREGVFVRKTICPCITFLPYLSFYSSHVSRIPSVMRNMRPLHANDTISLFQHFFTVWVQGLKSFNRSFDGCQRACYSWNNFQSQMSKGWRHCSHVMCLAKVIQGDM